MLNPCSSEMTTVFARFVARALIFFNQTHYLAFIQTGPYSSTGACYFQSKIVHKIFSVIGHHVGFNILNE